MRKLLIITCGLLMLAGCKAPKGESESQTKEAQSPVVEMLTTQGTITLELYNATPKHRDNFLKLVDEHFYDSLLFHRVIADFMIQGGDPDSKYAPAGVMLGEGDLGYTVPAEFNPRLVHNPYVLAAARMGDEVNPTKASSACQFYITHRAPHHLDGNYTVFGRVISGQQVVDAIATAETDAYDRPLEDIRILSVSRK